MRFRFLLFCFIALLFLSRAADQGEPAEDDSFYSFVEGEDQFLVNEEEQDFFNDDSGRHDDDSEYRRIYTYEPHETTVIMNYAVPTLYVIDVNGVIHALDSESGKEFWATDTGGSLITSSMSRPFRGPGTSKDLDIFNGDSKILPSFDGHLILKEKEEYYPLPYTINEIMDVSQLHIKNDKEDYSLFGDKTNSMMIINSVTGDIQGINQQGKKVNICTVDENMEQDYPYNTNRYIQFLKEQTIIRRINIPAMDELWNVTVSNVYLNFFGKNIAKSLSDSSVSIQYLNDYTLQAKDLEDHVLWTRTFNSLILSFSQTNELEYTRMPSPSLSEPFAKDYIKKTQSLANLHPSYEDQIVIHKTTDGEFVLPYSGEVSSGGNFIADAEHPSDNVPVKHITHTVTPNFDVTMNVPFWREGFFDSNNLPSIHDSRDYDHYYHNQQPIMIQANGREYYYSTDDPQTTFAVLLFFTMVLFCIIFVIERVCRESQGKMKRVGLKPEIIVFDDIVRDTKRHKLEKIDEENEDMDESKQEENSEEDSPSPQQEQHAVHLQSRDVESDTLSLSSTPISSSSYISTSLSSRDETSLLSSKLSQTPSERDLNSYESSQNRDHPSFNDDFLPFGQPSSEYNSNIFTPPQTMSQLRTDMSLSTSNTGFGLTKSFSMPSDISSFSKSSSLDEFRVSFNHIHPPLKRGAHPEGHPPGSNINSLPSLTNNMSLSGLERSTVEYLLQSNHALVEEKKNANHKNIIGLPDVLDVDVDQQSEIYKEHEIYNKIQIHGLIFPVCTGRYYQDFTELRLIGTGGFGKVYLCRKSMEEKEYAVKQIKLEFKRDHERRILRVLREVKVLAYLTHNNIVRFYSAWLEIDLDAYSKEKRVIFHSTAKKNIPEQQPTPLQESLSSSSLMEEASQEVSENASFFSQNHSLNKKLFTTSNDSDMNTMEQDILSDLNNHTPSLSQDIHISFTNSMFQPSPQGPTPVDSSSRPLPASDIQLVEVPPTLSSGSDPEVSICSSSSASSTPETTPTEAQPVGTSAVSDSMALSYSEHLDTETPLKKDSDLYLEDEVVAKAVEERKGIYNKKSLIMYIQMEYCGGRTLRSYLDDPHRVVNEFEILDVGLQIASAVSYMHKNSIIHRDIKPENIFYTSDGEIRLGDFGLSRYVGDTQNSSVWKWEKQPSNITTKIGTYLYASPEQIGNGDYGVSTDIFSVGLVLFEMANPHFDTSMERYKVLVNVRSLIFPEGLAISTTLYDFIKMMLSLQPSQRPTADQVHYTLESLKARYLYASPPNFSPFYEAPAPSSTHSSVTPLTTLSGKNSGRHGGSEEEDLMKEHGKSTPGLSVDSGAEVTNYIITIDDSFDVTTKMTEISASISSSEFSSNVVEISCQMKSRKIFVAISNDDKNTPQCVLNFLYSIKGVSVVTTN